VNDFVFAEQAGEPAFDSEDFPATVDGREHSSTNDGVEPGGVATAGRDGNAHGR
jgi:hypothetical protein